MKLVTRLVAGIAAWYALKQVRDLAQRTIAHQQRANRALAYADAVADIRLIIQQKDKVYLEPVIITNSDDVTIANSVFLGAGLEQW